MTSGNVTIERDGNVALVRFDRGARLNALDQTTILALSEVARRFHDDTKTRAVVLTGAANAFSAGIDLKDAATWDETEDDVSAEYSTATTSTTNQLKAR